MQVFFKLHNISFKDVI